MANDYRTSIENSVSDNGASIIGLARRAFHARLMDGPLLVDAKGVASIADKSNRLSIFLAGEIVKQLGDPLGERLVGQTSGHNFEEIVAAFVKETFPHCRHLRPGEWSIGRCADFKAFKYIGTFEPYRHLHDLEEACAESTELRAFLGNGYVIKPDVMVVRHPESDDTINEAGRLVDDHVCQAAALRRAVSPFPILHASISCKWTMCSDRAQNVRAEALNLIRHRKGRLPHIVVVTCEPVPSRLASIALGTGDIDCVYHFALPELLQAIDTAGKAEDARELLQIMIDGKRLKDISNLPLDLAV